MRLILALAVLSCVSGCQCWGLNDKYSSCVESLVDYVPRLDDCYSPCMDLTRIGQPDWCCCPCSSFWCPNACDKSCCDSGCGLFGGCGAGGCANGNCGDAGCATGGCSDGAACGNGGCTDPECGCATGDAESGWSFRPFSRMRNRRMMRRARRLGHGFGTPVGGACGDAGCADQPVIP